MEGEVKENDLRPISDRISGTIRRFLLEDLRDRGGMYGAIKSQMYAGCWNFKTLLFKTFIGGYLNISPG